MAWPGTDPLAFFRRLINEVDQASATCWPGAPR